jgi:hypothetical protein
MSKQRGISAELLGKRLTWCRNTLINGYEITYAVLAIVVTRDGRVGETSAEGVYPPGQDDNPTFLRSACVQVMCLLANSLEDDHPELTKELRTVTEKIRHLE